MIKLFILQPYLYFYRKNVFNNLSNKCKVTIAAENKVYIEKNSQITYIKSKIKSLAFGIYFQTKAINYSVIKDSDFIWIPLDISNISYLLAFLLSIVSNTKIILHTQGNYKRSEYSIFRKLLLRMLLASANMTLYYNESCFIEPYSKIKHRHKILNNRYECMPIPDDYVPTFSMSGNLLFIGRLRKRSGIISTCILLEKLIKRHDKLILNIIGDGPQFEYINNRFAKLIKSGNIVTHGLIDDYTKIANIAKECSIGIYLGDAGLSILHYMCLGLCPIVHNKFTSHMGPEPAYLVDGENSKLVEYENKIESAYKIVRDLRTNEKELYKIQTRAFEDAKRVHERNLSNEILECINQLNNCY